VPFESETIAIERADPLTRQLENFCAVIRNTAEPLVSARDACRTCAFLTLYNARRAADKPVWWHTSEPLARAPCSLYSHWLATLCIGADNVFVGNDRRAITSL
jgi:hypothetical protein